MAANGNGEEVLPTIALIGATGSGKSSTGNSLFGCRGNNVFHVEELSLASVTSETKVEVRHWRGGSGRRVRVVDSPGLGDSEGRDASHIAGLAASLKDDVRYVHVFLVVFNSQEPRLNIHLKEMLVTFRSMFGDGFLKHLMIAFTRFEFDKRSKKMRSRSGKTKEQVSTAMNEELRKSLGHGFDCPCVFIDNRLMALPDEDLEDLYDGELPEILQESGDEMEKIFDLMTRHEPFLCKDVKAVATERERLRGQIMQLIQVVDEKALGRKIISAEQGIMFRGKIRWRRRWLWGVLRRQHLRFFEDEHSDNLTGPREVDLTGCICSAGSQWETIGRYPTFTVYRPVNMQSNDNSYFCHIFHVRSEQERQRWVLFVQEATQVCESCHRIERFHSSLQTAPSKEEYQRAISLVEEETMVIPVEWVLQQVHTKGRAATLAQALKDLPREECIDVDGVPFKGGDGIDGDELASQLAAHVCARILQAHENEDGDKQAEVKAAVIARDVLLGSSRTQAGGDTFDAVDWFFRNDNDIVFCRPDNARSPILVRILRRSRATTEGDALRSMGPDTGVPQFQRDESASRLSADLWRRMDTNSSQTVSLHTIDVNAWVPDWQMVQCMRCGERFNPLLRRHHCRACGALVCYSCSRHWVEIAHRTSDEGTDGHAVRQRVCFLCYQKEVIKDLDARKERGLRPVVNEDDFASGDGSDKGSFPPTETSAEHLDCDLHSELSSGDVSTPADGEAEANDDIDENDNWPSVSIEMHSRFRVTSAENLDEEWYVLDCKYVRLVRWSGLADEGRIFISVSRADFLKKQSSLPSISKGDAG